MTRDALRLLRAADFAAGKHRDQRRKDATSSPYINHPVAVATLLADVGGVTDVDLLVAALLHDTVEDTNASLDEIAELFGNEVRDLVAEVTDDKSLPKSERKRLQVEHAPHLSNRAKQMKLADKICNLRDIDRDSPIGWDRQRKIEYVQWGERVAEGCRGVSDALDRLLDQTLGETRRRLQ